MDAFLPILSHSDPKKWIDFWIHANKYAETRRRYMCRDWGKKSYDFHFSHFYFVFFSPQKTIIISCIANKRNKRKWVWNLVDSRREFMALSVVWVCCCYVLFSPLSKNSVLFVIFFVIHDDRHVLPYTKLNP